MIVVWLFLTMPRVCLQFVIVEFPDHTHLLFFIMLLVNCLLLHPMFVGFCVWSLFCNAVLNVISSFAIIWLRKRALATEH